MLFVQETEEIVEAVVEEDLQTTNDDVMLETTDEQINPETKLEEVTQEVDDLAATIELLKKF